MPVHFLMDEFANVSLPDDFDKILSVMRSRGVSVSILQNLAQLKALFESNGKVSSVTVMSFSILVATSKAPTSMCRNCSAKKPLIRTPTVRVPDVHSTTIRLVDVSY